MKFRKMYACDSKPAVIDEDTLTVPDPCPSLREIILAGNPTQVGIPLYDADIESGYNRMRLQNAPLEDILAAKFGHGEEESSRDETSVKGEEFSDAAADKLGTEIPPKSEEVQ